MWYLLRSGLSSKTIFSFSVVLWHETCLNFGFCGSTFLPFLWSIWLLKMGEGQYFLTDAQTWWHIVCVCVWFIMVLITLKVLCTVHWVIMCQGQSGLLSWVESRQCLPLLTLCPHTPPQKKKNKQWISCVYWDLGDFLRVLGYFSATVLLN